MNFVYEQAENCQGGVKLYAEIDNETAIRVYERMGLKNLDQYFVEKDYYFEKNQ